MELKDIFQKIDENNFRVNVATYEPNTPDEELQKTFDEWIEGLQMKVGALCGISGSEFAKHRQEIADGFYEDVKSFKAITEELMSMRKLTTGIQEERDLLAKYIAEEVLGGKNIREEIEEESPEL